MANYAYNHYFVVYDWQTGVLASNRSDGRLLDDNGVQVTVRDVNGLETPLRTGPAGVIENFTAPVSHGTAVFGTVRTSVMSDAAMDGATAAEAAAASAASVAASVQYIAENATEVSYLYRDTAGDVWVSDTPVVVGGGKPRVDAAGDVWVDFPLT